DKACRLSFCFAHRLISRDSSTSLGMTIESGEVSPHSKSGSAHFQLFSQDEVQHDKQYECGHDEHCRVESKHAERDSEIALLKTEEHVRLIAAAVIVLLHLGSRDQVRHFLVHIELVRCDWPLRIFEQRAIESLLPRDDRIDQLQVSVYVTPRLSFQARQQCQYVFQVVKVRSLLRRVTFRCELLNFVMSAVLALGKRIELGLGDDHFFVRPAHGDELADKWHLQFALRFSRLFRVRMFGKPVRKGINQAEVPVHVLVFDERATHNDLWNQNQRDDIGRCFRVGHQRRDNETQRYAAHRRQEHYSQVEPEHAPNLQDEITDEHEKNALNERKKAER